jgi:hypothetical protein
MEHEGQFSMALGLFPGEIDTIGGGSAEREHRYRSIIAPAHRGKLVIF